MDNLEILIQAILSLKDTTRSKNQILSELPKLEGQLQSDSKSRVKILAGLDITKSKNLIQSQLATIANQANAPTIKVGIDVGNKNATQNITAGLKDVQTQAQQTKQTMDKLKVSVHDIHAVLDGLKFDAVRKKAANGNNITDTVKTIENAKNMFSTLGFNDVQFTWTDKAKGAFEKLTATVKDSYGVVQQFKFALSEDTQKYNYAGSVGSDKNVETVEKNLQKIKALRINLHSELQSIKQEWQDANGGKSVKDSGNVDNLKKQYLNVAQAIRQLKNADASTLPVMQANVDKQTDKLRRMVSEYHNAEKVATQLRAKGFETVKIDTGNNIDKFINSINNSKVPIGAMRTEVDKLKQSFASLDNIQDQSAKSSVLTGVLNQLDNAQTKFQSLKELFKGIGNSGWLSVNAEQIKKIDDATTRVAIYKETLKQAKAEWGSQITSVDGINNKIKSLSAKLGGIKKPESLNKWLDEFIVLNKQATNLKTNLDSQVNSQNKIYEIQSQIAKLNPTKDTAEITRLNEKLNLEQKTLSNLQMQSNVFSNLITLEEQEKYITNQTAVAREKMLSAINGGIKAYTAQVEGTIKELQKLQSNTVFKNNASNPQVTQTKQDITALIGEYQKLKIQLQGNVTPEGLKVVEAELAKLNSRFNIATTSAKNLQTALADTNGVDKLTQKTELLIARIEAYKKANSNAIKMYGGQFESMLAELRSGNLDNIGVDKISKQFQVLRQEINTTGKAGKTFFRSLVDNAAKFFKWMSMTYVISTLTRSVRSMVTSVVELDTALVDLKKTFTGTETDLKNFYISANQTAKDLGVTTKQIIEQASAWSRLGYSSAETAELMAKNSAIFKTISPGMDMDTATDGLVSMMKAFDIEANDVLDGIMSKVNIVGKFCRR